MAKKSEPQLERLRRIVESIKEKVSGCEIRDISSDIADFTDTHSNIKQVKLDRFQNDRLREIEKEYYLAIERIGEECSCKPKIDTKGFSMMMRDRARYL